jgi:hypothetical protein
VATTAVPAPHADEARPGSLKIIATALGCAFAISALVIVVSRSVAPPTQAPAALAAAAATPAAAAPVHDEPEVVDLTVRVAPPSAQISVDGANVAANPFHARYRKDRQVHHVLASADGYDPKLEDILLTGDVAIDVSLDRHAPPAPSAHKAPPPAPAPPPARAVRHAAAPPASSDSPPSPPPSATTTSAAPEVNPTGGHAPLRPIVTSSPYGSQ